MSTTKEHWEKVYATKQPNEVSWTQDRPTSSLDLIARAAVSKECSIIDVGGGDSRLVDFLIEAAYKDISVLDISLHALERAKSRLGSAADDVHWIEADIRMFQPDRSYDIWHDRAVFHFLTDADDIKKYVALVSSYVKEDLIIATFSKEGPLRCSGLDISQYDKHSIQAVFESAFDLLNSFTVDHVTPFGTKQNFLFAHFKRRQSIC